MDGSEKSNKNKKIFNAFFMVPKDWFSVKKKRTVICFKIIN